MTAERWFFDTNWDSLIIESAIGCGAQRLWTEDLQDGQAFGDLVIVNPFGV